MRQLILILITTISLLSCSEKEVNPLNVSTRPVTEITANTAESGGKMVDSNGIETPKIGICWDTSPNVSINNNYTNQGPFHGGNGFFTKLTGLKENTTYYIKAYAINSIGIVYGEELSFTTNSSIYQGDIHISTQKNIDEFISNGYKVINGNLQISTNYPAFHSTEISNLNGLINLNSIKGDLIIHNNPLLKNLSGLENINTIGGNLFISRTDIMNFEYLKKISSIGENFEIISNKLLINLEGLNNLSYIGEDLNIYYNSELNDFCEIRPLFLKNGLKGEYDIKQNLYNPTTQNIFEGNCNQ